MKTTALAISRIMKFYVETVLFYAPHMRIGTYENQPE
jgi:hypothetical protein